MSHDFSSTLDDQILSALVKASILPRGQSVQLQRYPLNFNRKDTRRRAAYRVWNGGKVAFHLTVGAKLKGLFRLAEDFARANPEIACKPLFLIKEQGLELFGQEYFGIGNLEEGLADRRIDENTWRNAVVLVKAKLATTGSASSPSRMMQELNALEQRVLSLEWFSHFDLAFIRDAILPLIRHGATQLAARTQWSNGDFIAKNILFDGTGEYRLIDVEFASETHFAEIDWFRLRRFSNVPAQVDVSALAGLRPHPVWLELLSWLQHALRLNEVCLPGVVGPNLKIVSENITRLLARDSSFAQRSYFVGNWGASPSPDAENRSEAPGAALALEWSRSGSQVALHKASLPLENKAWHELNYTLNPSEGRTLLARLQLPFAPAIIDLRSLELRDTGSGAVIWSAAGHDLAKIVALGGNAITMKADQGLRIVHFGQQADLTLPAIDLGQLQNALKLTVWLHYTPSVEEFSLRLRDALNSGQAALAFAEPALPGAKTETAAIAPAAPTAQLFFPNDGVYSEERSVTTHVSLAPNWQEMVLPVPPQVAGSILRFDPSNHPGLYEVAQIHFEVSAEGQDPYRILLVDGQNSASSAVSVGGECVLLSDRKPLTFLFYGEDPILFLPPLPESVAGCPGRLVVAMRVSAAVSATDWMEGLGQMRLQHTNAALLNAAQLKRDSLLSKEVQDNAVTNLGQVQLMVTELSVKRDELLLAVTEARREQATLSATLAERDAELTSIRSVLREKLGLPSGSDADLLHAAAALADVGATLATRDAALTALQAAFVEADRGRKTAEIELEKNRKETSLLQSGLAARDLDLRLTREVLTDAVRIRATLENELTAARQDAEKLRAALNVAESDLVSTRNQLTESTTLCQELKAGIETARQECAEASALEAALNILRGQHNLVLQSLHAQNAALHDFKLRAGFVAKELQLLTDRAEKAEAECDALKCDATRNHELLAERELQTEQERSWRIAREADLTRQQATLETLAAEQKLLQGKLTETEARLAETQQAFQLQQRRHEDAVEIIQRRTDEVTRLEGLLAVARNQASTEEKARIQRELELAELRRRPLVRIDAALRGAQKVDPSTTE